MQSTTHGRKYSFKNAQNYSWGSKMSNALLVAVSMVGGIFVCLLAFLAYKAFERAKATASALFKGLSNISRMAESNDKLAEIGSMVCTELQLLRSVISQQDPTTQETSYTPPTQQRPTPGVPFPHMPVSVYAPAPDASEDDLVVTYTEDDKMADLERIEKLKDAGYDAE